MNVSQAGSIAEHLIVSKAIETLQAAQERAIAGRPKVGGFPYPGRDPSASGREAKCVVPAIPQPVLTNEGSMVTQGARLVSGSVDVPAFDRDALIRALRKDQAGERSSRSSDVLVACGSRLVRCRFRRTHGNILRLQWREIR